MKKIEQFIYRQEINQYHRIAKEESGLKLREILKKMNFAENIGISNKTFVKYEAWTKEESGLIELKAELDRKRKLREEKRKKREERQKRREERERRKEELRKERREKRIQVISKEMGWSTEETESKMDEAKSLGIPNAKYFNQYVFQLPEDEVMEFAKAYEALKEKWKKDKEFYIKVIMDKTGWDYEKILEDMEQAKKKKVPMLQYSLEEYFNFSDEDKERFRTFWKEDKKRIKANRNIYIEGIVEQTGWTKGKAELEVMKAKVNCGASYEDYYAYRFFELTEEEQKEYITFEKFMQMRMKYNDQSVVRTYFNDKQNFNKTFQKFMYRIWFGNQDISYEQFLENIKGLDRIIVKPLAESKGKGIEVFSCNESEEKNRELYEYIIGLAPSVVEEFLKQHEEMSGFCQTSVNTIRIATLNENGHCRFLYSVFRMGQGKSVDNFHAGGIAASVNVENGIVYTNAADLNGNFFETSPLTGKQIKGFQIPHWDQIIEICKQAMDLVEGVNLIGWDFAITPDSVELIEGNPGVSYIMAQIPNIQDRIGLASVMLDANQE